MLIHLILLSWIAQTVKPHGKLPEQDLQMITITLLPSTKITSQTKLKVLVQHKLGNYSTFGRNDLFSISKEFEKMFSYSPWDKKTNIDLRKFRVEHLFDGFFEVICTFETEIDEDTHWEVLWFGGEQGKDIPMTTFFVKADLPTVMEVVCREMYSADCNRLMENDDIIITCMIKTGMPFLKAYLEFPQEATPVYLLKTHRRIEAKLKLTRATYLKTVNCGSNGVNLTVRRPFQFLLESLESKEQFDSVLVTVVVTLACIVTISCVILGIYVILIKPSKERTMEKVLHHVDVSSEVTKNPISAANILESRKSFIPKSETI